MEEGTLRLREFIFVSPEVELKITKYHAFYTLISEKRKD